MYKICTGRWFAPCLKLLNLIYGRQFHKRISENFLLLYLRPVDPPKSPLKRGTLTLVTPLKRGARGDQAQYLILLIHPLR